MTTSWFVEKLIETEASHGKRIAVSHNGRTTSYSDFLEMVRKFATVFATFSDKPKVAICAEASAETYAAMFAALYSGGFYVPLNAQVGETRLLAALQSVKPDVVVTTAATVRSSPMLGSQQRLLTIEDFPSVNGRSAEPRDAHHLAYVMFTSGSTGVPKGVMISQTALMHHLKWAADIYGVKPEDRWSQHHNIGFDLSVLDIFCCLLNGATLCPLTGQLDRLFPARAIRRERITIWHSVPSTMGMILQSGDWNAENAQSIRLMTFCGEPLLPEHLEGIFKVLPQMEVYNTYGPTEATILCSLLRLHSDDFRNWCRASVALGTPIQGMGFKVEGEQIDGVKAGELLIFGPQLADGYWEDAERTNAAFKMSMVNGASVRVYHTGDFVEDSSKGLYFIERRDNQVKIKGHRIELNEVSSHLRKLGYVNAESFAIKDSIVSVVEGDYQDGKAEDLRKALRGKLEAYMVPSRILFLKRFPRNTNEKTDIKELRAWCINKDDSKH